MENIRDSRTYNDTGAAALTPSLMSSFHPSMSWRSTLAGVVVSLLAFGTMMSLGVAIGGVSLVDGASLQSAGLFSGLWVLLSVIVALFASSYFAARLSNFPSRRIGAGQGVVVAATFFGVILWQAVGVLGWTASAVGSVAGGVAQVAGPAASQADVSGIGRSPMLRDLVEDSLGGVEIRGDMGAVVAGLASRLVRGDTEAAKGYLARHSNLTSGEIDQRIGQIQGQVDGALNDARVATARTLQASGWSMFAMFILGLIASAIGGGLGSRVNMRTPMTADNPVRGRGYRSAS